MAKDRGPAVPYVSDEGRSHERTELAWGRSGLAVMVAVGVLARRVWTLHGVPGVVGLSMVGIGALVWLAGMRISRDLHEVMVPHGMLGRHAFALISAGTIILALGGLVFGVLVTR